MDLYNSLDRIDVEDTNRAVEGTRYGRQNWHITRKEIMKGKLSEVNEDY